MRNAPSFTALLAAQPHPEDSRDLERFEEALWSTEGLAPTTRAGYALNLRTFARFCAARGKTLRSAQRYDVEAFLAALYTQQRAGTHAARRYLAALRKFYGALVLQAVRADDPTQHVAGPKLPPVLPKTLPQSATGRLLQARVAGAEHEALRDRAMLELAYGAGLRVSELVGLKMNCLDLQAGHAKVRGKGNRERQVPLGEPAVDALQAYLTQARPRYLRLCRHSHDAGFVFLTRYGRPMSRQFFWQRVKTLARAAGLDPARVSPHVLRHCYATDLLTGGADLRTLQLLLGHENIVTTTVYTQVGRARLKELHKQHHPRG